MTESAGAAAIVPRATFVDLYEANYRRMVQVARLTTGSTMLAEELVQDAFADVFRRFDEVQAPEAYLRRAVMSRCTSWVRRRAVERRHGEHLRSEMAPWKDPATVEVMDAVAKLSARQRAAVVLRYFSDWSEREIADALRCRPGTVKSLLSRAAIQLAKELRNDH